MAGHIDRPRRPFPLGRLRRPTATVVFAARRPRLIVANRYPGQVIGVAVRLPRDEALNPPSTRYPMLSIQWAKPSRWWK